MNKINRLFIWCYWLGCNWIYPNFKRIL